MGDMKTQKLQIQIHVFFWSYSTMYGWLHKTIVCDKPSHLILHIRTSDLNSSKTVESIATSIVEEAIIIEDDHHDVSVSNTVIRKNHWKKKVEEINSYLKELCMKNNIFLIDHSKSIRQCHLSKNRLHLNSKGSTVLGETFVNHLWNIFDWRIEKKLYREDELQRWAYV